MELMLKKKENPEINLNLLDTAIDKFFSPITANFIKEQARLFKVNTKGRRYSDVLKQQCLSLYFSSLTAYKTLSKLFCLLIPQR